MSPRNKTPFITWKQSQVERLVTWMEANHDALLGKQTAWHKQVKEAVFPTEEHITVKKISEKALNMKTSWKNARALADRSGWGARPEDNETLANKILERKCLFYWRLDAIWGGTGPKATGITSREATVPQPEPAAQLTTPQVPFQSTSQLTPELTSQSASQSISEATARSPAAENPQDPKDKPPSTPPPRSPSTAPPTRPKTPIPAPPPPRSPKPNLTNILQQAIADKHTFDQNLAEQKMKLKQETQIEVARIQAEAAREAARIQAEGQVRQMEIFAWMMRDVLRERGGGSRGGEGEGEGSRS